MNGDVPLPQQIFQLILQFLTHDAHGAAAIQLLRDEWWEALTARPPPMITTSEGGELRAMARRVKQR